MQVDFFIGEDDRLPTIRAYLEDETGAIDLTGGTVSIKGRKIGTTTTISGACTIDDAVTGAVSYQWAAADTQIPGMWYLQWQFTIGGKIGTVPNRGSDALWINEFWAST